MSYRTDGRFRTTTALVVTGLYYLMAGASVRADCLVACDRVRLIWSKDLRSTEPLFRVVRGKKIGYVDAKGALKIPYRFDYDESLDWDFVEGLAPVLVGQKWGYINPKGRMIIPAQFEWAGPFSEGRALVRFGNDGPIGYIDQTGKQVGTQTVNGAAQPFHQGLAAIEVSRNKWGYMDSAGMAAIEPSFAWARSFSEGVARVIESGECEVFEDPCDCMDFTTSVGLKRDRVLRPCTFSYIDKAGKSVLSGFNNAYDFSEGLAAVRSSKAWGFINHEGTVVIAEQFQRVKSFSEGLAAVMEDGRWGFIDRTGTTVIPFQFDFVEDFSEGRAVVLKDQEYTYIDQSGKQLFGRTFALATSFVQGLAHVGFGSRSSGDLGYINRNGTVVHRYRSRER